MVKLPEIGISIGIWILNGKRLKIDYSNLVGGLGTQLDAAGFVDLQDIACAKWGQPIQPTCKQTTRKDFCYVSRELAAMLKEVHVNHDIFPDHAVLYGVFRNLSTISPRFVWPCPKQFPWPASWKVDPAMWTSDPWHSWHEISGGLDTTSKTAGVSSGCYPVPWIPRISQGLSLLK